MLQKTVTRLKEFKLSSLSNSWKALNLLQLISFFRVLLWAIVTFFVLLFVLMIFKGLKTDGYIVQPFKVPQSLENSGYTGDVFADHLVDKVGELIAQANSVKEDSLQLEIDFKPDMNLQMMGVGLSVDGIVHYLRALLGIEVKTISGELIDLDKELRLVLRVTDYPNYKIIQNYSKHSPLHAIDEILEKAGKRLLQRTDPYRLAVLEYKMGNLERAEELIREIIHSRPHDRKWAYLIWGNLKSRLNENERAKEYYEKSLEIDPSFEMPNRNLGWLYYKIKDYENAILYFEKVIKVNPKNYGAVNGMALSNQYLGKSDEAEKAYLKNIENHESNLWSYGNYSEFLMRVRKDTLRAINIWKNVSSKVEKNEKYYVALAGLQIFQENLDSAEIFVDKALDYDPGNVPALQILTNLYKEKKDYVKLDTIIKRRIKSLEDRNFDRNMQVMAYNDLAMNDYKQQKYDSALVHVQKAIDLSPSNPYPWSTLAETYAYMGNEDLFFKHLDKAMSLGFDPKFFLTHDPYNLYANDPRMLNLLEVYASRVKG